MGPIFDDCGLNVTVMSYLDHVDFGFIACRELVPDVDELAAAVPEALAELVKAAGSTLAEPASNSATSRATSRGVGSPRRMNHS